MSAGGLVGSELTLAEANPLVPGLAPAPSLRRASAGISLTPSTTRPYWACPEGLCDAIIDPPAMTVAGTGHARFALPMGGPALEGSGEEGGFDPQDLRSAYDIPTSGGEGETIAVIGAYGYKEAEAHLAVYRERYGLPPCTKKHHCFTRVNQHGERDRAKTALGWAQESALDMDMVSAACPACHILLVEAENGYWAEFAEAVETAVRLGATEVSNSYGTLETECSPECRAAASAYDHPGVLMTVSAGDTGYGDSYRGGELAESANFPASLPSVVAVGGTALRKAATARGWSEEVWSERSQGSGTGGGCSLQYAAEKPLWQNDGGCGDRRTDNDVAAVAACQTPVSSYSVKGWALVCGTSASAPLVAGIEAHASAYARSLPGADAFYHDPAALFDVTSGSNGLCTPPSEDEYLCHAEVGYDGPSGNGTPDGPLLLTSAPPDVRSVAPSGLSGTGVTLRGIVEPQGAPTSYRFEYGTGTAYGESAPLPEGSVSGTAAQTVSQTVGGLQPETVYHYRVVASNSAGTSYGRDESFTSARPVVTAVVPASGPTEGGTVTISGLNFLQVSAVRFGSSEAEGFTVDSEHEITAVAPVGTGIADVTVETLAGTSEASAGGQLAYEEGPVLSWGGEGGLLEYDPEGLGRRLSLASNVPVEVDGLPEATALAANRDGYAIEQNGEVMAWGEGYEGELGDGLEGQHTTRYVPVHVCAVGVSECAGGPYLGEATAVAAGAGYALVLLKNGTVVAWGRNGEGQLGGSASLNVRSPVPAPVCMVVEDPCSPEHYLREVVAVAAAYSTSYALLANGTVMAWGANQEGQLGDESEGDYSIVPVAVKGLSDVTAIAAGGEDGYALLGSGIVKAWGFNQDGELGNNLVSTKIRVPFYVCAGGTSGCAKALEGVQGIAAGAEDGYALLKGGTVVAWGYNKLGELGSGEEKGPEICHPQFGHKSDEIPCSRFPVPVSSLSAVSALAAGNNALARLDDGELMTWGPGNGDLGDGSSARSDVPVHVCAVYAGEPCPDGPYLSGRVSAMAVGYGIDLVSFAGAP